MDIDVASVLKAIGPAASVIFAAWIFVGFLQQRYDSTVGRHKNLIEEYRANESDDTRRANMRDQIIILKRRCELMNHANTLGLFSAILLILSLIVGEIGVILPKISVFKYVTVASSLIGFALVIVGTCFLIEEGRVTWRQLDAEVLDIPDLAAGTGQEAGKVPEQKGDASEPGRRKPHMLSS